MGDILHLFLADICRALLYVVVVVVVRYSVRDRRSWLAGCILLLLGTATSSALRCLDLSRRPT